MNSLVLEQGSAAVLALATPRSRMTDGLPVEYTDSRTAMRIMGEEHFFGLDFVRQTGIPVKRMALDQVPISQGMLEFAAHAGNIDFVFMPRIITAQLINNVRGSNPSAPGQYSERSLKFLAQKQFYRDTNSMPHDQCFLIGRKPIETTLSKDVQGQTAALAKFVADYMFADQSVPESVANMLADHDISTHALGALIENRRWDDAGEFARGMEVNRHFRPRVLEMLWALALRRTIDSSGMLGGERVVTSTRSMTVGSHASNGFVVVGSCAGGIVVDECLPCDSQDQTGTPAFVRGIIQD